MGRRGARIRSAIGRAAATVLGVLVDDGLVALGGIAVLGVTGAVATIDRVAPLLGVGLFAGVWVVLGASLYRAGRAAAATRGAGPGRR